VAKVVAVLSEKGGAGKTTVAVHLAVAARLAFKDAAIIDLDPQASAAEWADRRASEPEAVAIPPTRLAKMLTQLSDSYLVIIDTGRDSNNAGYTAAMAADLILIPFRSSGFDFAALARTLDLCKLAGKIPWLVLNGMRPGATRVTADTMEALAGRDCKIAPPVIHDRAAYRMASITAKTAQETDPKSAAAEEIRQLYTWMARQLES